MYTPENITELKPNEIFVFGSNMNGAHLGGAAKLAVEKFGAIMGQAEGLQGQSYAVPTLDENMNKVDLGDLDNSVVELLSITEAHPELIFYVTKLGLGIAGFSLEEVSNLFQQYNWPENVVLPVEFGMELVWTTID